MHSIRYALLLLVLAFANNAKSAVTVELGAGINGSRQSSLVMLGVARDAGYFAGFPTYQVFNVGSWNGRYDASTAGVAQGITLGVGSTLVQLSLGGAYVSETSDRLSTEFEFYEQLLLRKKLGGIELALSYRHWSNAGMRQPNAGMDFVSFIVSQRW